MAAADTKLGPWGEALAAAFLRKRGYHIVATNYRSRYGEIDIIAENAEYLVFAEVKLRSELRKANVEYTVVKNTLVRFAANQIGFEELDGVLHGTTAMAVSMDDPTAPARLLAEFAKSHDKYFNIKAGFLEGKVVDVATVESLAAIPPKDILLSTVLGTMMAPVAALARVLQAVADKKSEGGEAAPAAEAETQA